MSLWSCLVKSRCESCIWEACLSATFNAFSICSFLADFLCVSFCTTLAAVLLTYSMHSWTSALWNSGAIDAVTLQNQHSPEDASRCHDNLVNSTPPLCPHKTFLVLKVALFCYYNTQRENSNWKGKSNWPGWDASRKVSKVTQVVFMEETLPSMRWVSFWNSLQYEINSSQYI